MKKLFFLILFLAPSLVSIVAQQAHINLDWDPQKNKENLIPFCASTAPAASTSEQFMLRAPAVDPRIHARWR